jgi:hypothetical protein
MEQRRGCAEQTARQGDVMADTCSLREHASSSAHAQKSSAAAF